jgi:hypothetical protein
MQTFVQVKQVIHYSKMIHVRLRDVYGSLNEMDQPERVKMLLNYLIVDQHRIEGILSNFEAVSQQSVMDNWMQYAPSIDVHQLLDHQPIKPEMTLDEIVQLAIKYGEVLVAFYLEAAKETDLPKVSDIFKNLAEMEIRDNHKQFRAALFEGM